MYIVRKQRPQDIEALKKEIAQLKVVVSRMAQLRGENDPAVVTQREDLAKLVKAATTQPAAEAAKPGVIAVSGRRLASGDLTENIVVRPGDMIIARGLDQSPARLVIHNDGSLTFRSERTTWADLAKLIEQIPAAQRARTTLVVSPGSEEMTLRQLNEAEHLATALAKEYGFKELMVLRTAITPPATRRRAVPGPASEVEADAASVAERMRRRREQENAVPAAPPAPTAFWQNSPGLVAKRGN